MFLVWYRGTLKGADLLVYICRLNTKLAINTQLPSILCQKQKATRTCFTRPVTSLGRVRWPTQDSTSCSTAGFLLLLLLLLLLLYVVYTSQVASHKLLPGNILVPDSKQTMTRPVPKSASL